MTFPEQVIKPSDIVLIQNIRIHPNNCHGHVLGKFCKGSRMTRVSVRPELLCWACERSGVANLERLHKRFPKLGEWKAGKAQPTLKQLEAFARTVHVPIGYLFLSEPPEESLPISDFRIFNGCKPQHASPNLLDTLYACQERQYWYQDFAQAEDMPKATFVGSAKLSDQPQHVAAHMAEVLGFDLAVRDSCRTWQEALRLLITQADAAGVLVMVSSVVRANTRRHLDLKEFRGFALADSHAPLVFINGAGTQSDQMFALAHKLAHLWLGSSALSNANAAPLANDYPHEEIWCSKVAAELLVPLTELKSAMQSDELPDQAVQRLAQQFKVGTPVILRRLLDVGWLNQLEFERRWTDERVRLRELEVKSIGGGNFYNTTLPLLSRRFTLALVESTLEGQTLYRDAFRMLDVKKTEAFSSIARNVGVME